MIQTADVLFPFLGAKKGWEVGMTVVIHIGKVQETDKGFTVDLLIFVSLGLRLLCS